MPETGLSEKDLALVHEAIGFLWRSTGKNVRRLREARGLTQARQVSSGGTGIHPNDPGGAPLRGRSPAAA